MITRINTGRGNATIDIESADLDLLEKRKGQVIICKDTGETFYDVSSTERIQIGGNKIPVNPQNTANLNLWIEDR